MARAAGRRKNVLVVMADEQSWDTLGAHGNSVARTPHLDSLAARGASFRHSYTPYPLCCPARASLWTGLLPHTHHVMGNWRRIRTDLADGGLVHAFVGAGYHTVYTGKWHVPGTTPAQLGFADTAAIPAVVKGRDKGRYIEPYRAHVQALGYRLAHSEVENLTERDMAQLRRPGRAPCGTAEIRLEHYLETWQTGQFLERLAARSADRPFFAVCSYNAPHFPMIVPEPYDRLIDPDDVALPPSLRSGPGTKPAEVARSKFAQHAADLDEGEWRRLIAHYFGMCALVDAQVGRIIGYLETERLLDDTVVVFTADHGDMMGAHGLLEKGYPLHYEQDLRVPLIIADPDSPGGARPDGIVTLLDVLPTVAELTGVALPAGHEGVSAAAALGDAGALLRPHALAETFTFNGAEGGDGEYISIDDFEAQRGTANLSIRTPGARYVFRWNDVDELYDLSVDPHEIHNLARDAPYRAQVERLRRALLGEVERSAPRFGQLVRARMDAMKDAAGSPEAASSRPGGRI